MSSPGDITQILQRLRRGDPTAEPLAFERLYVTLRRIAVQQMRRERKGHTLQPTALVHEAYLQIVRQADHEWKNRAHFLAVAAQVMRRVLIDHARKRGMQKRGGGVVSEPLEETKVATGGLDVGILDLDRALNRLNEIDGRQARIVECRYFGGMSEAETAEVLGMGVRTVRRDWAVARAWLYGELHPQSSTGPVGSSPA